MNDFNFNNPKLNIALSPIALIIAYFVFERFGYPLSGLEHYQVKSLLVFFGVYAYASFFFQPDLDHYINRPGKGYFPIGKKATVGIERAITALMSIVVRRKVAISISSIFGSFVQLTASIWDLYWHPYAQLFTHRGLPHWPIIGTLSRVYWIYLPFLAIKFITGFEISIIEEIVQSFHIWKPNHLTLVIAFPIISSDIFHSSVDAVESLIKGYSFCPPRIPRGILAKVFRITL